jgi:RND family efflux transporter MFP subunit
VKVVAAKQMHMAPTVWLPGSIVSRDDARVAAEVDGRLVSVAEVGTHASTGDPVARIDDTELKILRAEAEAVVLRERAKRQFAEQELSRLKSLTGKGLVTKSRLDQARAERDAAHGEWRVARARLDGAQDRLNDTTIAAPFAGVVAERYRRVGERVSAGDEVIRLVSPDSLEAQVRIPPASLPHVTLGTEVRVRANPAQTNAQVRSVVPIGDDRSRLYDVRLTLQDTHWPAGTTVRVSVPIAKPKQVVAVPRDALVLRSSGVSVFRVGDDGKAQLIRVDTGLAEGGMIEVIGNINPGDQVITRGGELLRPGQALQIMPNQIPE